MASFLVSRILSQIPAYVISDDTDFDSLGKGQTDGGLEMSLAKHYFDDWLVSIKQQDHSFSRTERKTFRSQHTREGIFNY